MNRQSKIKAALRAVYHYLVFFLLVAFIISCCMMLFLSALSNSLEISLTKDNIRTAAILTFGNVLLLSFLFSVIDAFRRKVTVERPTKEIQKVLMQLKNGNFRARIETSALTDRNNHFAQIAEDINALADELSGVETLRTDFIANVSHELKTPLAVIQSYGTMLQQPGLPEEKRLEYAKSVADGSRRLADLITNILKLDKLENQQIYPCTDKYDLGEQLCESLLQFENIWEKKNIEINTDIEDNVGIYADRELLSIVWNNLLSNAFKFTESGGTVSVIMTADTDYATVEISDTGCGMSPEVGAHIFEKFYQGDTSHSSPGNGLGLALVKRVIDIIQGEIEVHSIPGKGSTFTVKIRRKANEAF